MQLSWAIPGDVPPGFIYRPEFVSEPEERALAAQIRAIDFAEVKMHGVVARRRTAHFGWLYGYETARIAPGPPIPEFLLPLRERVGELAGVTPDALAEILVTEYSPGSGIGWHRDAPMFDVVAGVSLLGPCRLRFEHGKSADREMRAVTLAPRSAYLLTGEAREVWRHSIPPMKAQRYSVTFRTLRTGATRRAVTPPRPS